MSRSLNSVQLIGNVGSDPEIRSTAGGGRVATLSLATSRQWVSAGGEKQEKTEWHKVVFWNRKNGGSLVDVIEKYVKKGDRLYVGGSIEYRTWQDKENQTRYSTEVQGRDLIMLGGKNEDAARPASSKAKAGALSSKSDFEDFPAALEDSEDDLPW